MEQPDVFAKAPFSWECPFCGRPTTVTQSDHRLCWNQVTLSNGERRSICNAFVVCPNPECRRTSVGVALFETPSPLPAGAVLVSGPQTLTLIRRWTLVPPSAARVFPQYIPAPLRADYEEACVIRELSPKASASLSRRCLQGMIRDFWGIKVKSNKLKDEIDAIKDKVAEETWKAIDGVRTIGNIGAHMEADVNTIIDVEPEEAGLVWLIESLMTDWYVARHEREARLKKIVAVAGTKAQQKKQKPAPNTAPPGP